MITRQRVHEVLAEVYGELRYPLDDPSDIYSVIGEVCQSRARYSGEEIELQIRAQDALDYGLENTQDRYVVDIDDLTTDELRRAIGNAQTREVLVGQMGLD